MSEAESKKRSPVLELIPHPPLGAGDKESRINRGQDWLASPTSDTISSLGRVNWAYRISTWDISSGLSLSRPAIWVQSGQ